MPFKAANPRILLSDQAMFNVDYFPPNTPPDEWISFNGTSPS
jgi:hypothetical protein